MPVVSKHARKIDPYSRECLRAIITALAVPRNRFGKLESSGLTSNKMQEYAVALQIPHGGLDAVDQACMILQRLLGDEPCSILDQKKKP